MSCCKLRDKMKSHKVCNKDNYNAVILQKEVTTPQLLHLVNSPEKLSVLAHTYNYAFKVTLIQTLTPFKLNPL